jgi:putative ABC transport system ATP-binding protein
VPDSPISPPIPPSRPAPAIRVVDVWKEYVQDGREAVCALRGAHMEVAKGEIVALFGKSGSGKTTLLNLLAGLDRPTKGTIEVDGGDLSAMGEKGLVRLRRLRLGFVFQFFNLLPTLTAFENVYLSLELAGITDADRAAAALADVGLAGKEARYPHELSGGEQQRVAIARAIVKAPAIILADEPTGNLDSRTGEQVLELLHGRCRASGTTLVMASHSAATGRHADRILRMEDGVLVEEGRSGIAGRPGLPHGGGLLP